MYSRQTVKKALLQILVLCSEESWEKVDQGATNVTIM